MKTFYVKINGDRCNEDRLHFIEFLEENGFVHEETNPVLSRECVIDSKLPVIVDVDSKTYSVMGNVTCAAAAESSNRISTVEEFLVSFKNMETQ